MLGEKLRRLRGTTEIVLRQALSDLDVSWRIVLLDGLFTGSCGCNGNHMVALRERLRSHLAPNWRDDPKPGWRLFF